MLGLLAYEWAFTTWEKHPFTCSRLPGKTPIWMILAFFGLIGVVATVHTLLLATLYNSVALALVLAGLAATWTLVHRMRRQEQTALRLKYEDVPAPAIHALNLLK